MNWLAYPHKMFFTTADTVRNITPNFQLGFGSFVEKPTHPFVQTGTESYGYVSLESILCKYVCTFCSSLSMHWQWVAAVSAQQIACVRYVRTHVVLLRSHLTISAENTSMYFITTKFIWAAPASLKLHASMYVCMLYGNMYTYVATRSSVQSLL